MAGTSVLRQGMTACELVAPVSFFVFSIFNLFQTLFAFSGLGGGGGMSARVVALAWALAACRSGLGVGGSGIASFTSSVGSSLANIHLRDV